MRFFILLLAVSLVASGAQAKQRNKPAKAKSDAETSANAAVGDSNGEWTIESSTTVGQCSGLVPSTMRVADNKIAAASDASIASWGYVDDAGTLVARFTSSGERVARFHGTLRGGKGSGAWSSSTDMCGGTWRATRTGAATVAAPSPEQSGAEQTAPPQ